MRSLDRGLGRLRVDVERARVDVAEDRPGALVEDAVRRGDEAERRGDDLVAAARRRRRAARGGGPRCRSRPPTRAATPSRARESALELRQPRARARAAASAATSRTSSSSRAPDRRARQRDHVVAHPGGRPAAVPAWRGSIPASSESTSASQLDLDHVLGDADRAPGVGAVAGVEQHPRDRLGALGLVEDADLEVRRARCRAGAGRSRPDGVAQRAVERVHRAVALGGAHVALAVDPDLDRGLGLHPAVLALLGDHAPGLEPEERLVVARLLAG